MTTDVNKPAANVFIQDNDTEISTEVTTVSISQARNQKYNFILLYFIPVLYLIHAQINKQGIIKYNTNEFAAGANNLTHGAIISEKSGMKSTLFEYIFVLITQCWFIIPSTNLFLLYLSSFCTP